MPGPGHFVEDVVRPRKASSRCFAASPCNDATSPLEEDITYFGIYNGLYRDIPGALTDVEPLLVPTDGDVSYEMKQNRESGRGSTKIFKKRSNLITIRTASYTDR